MNRYETVGIIKPDVGDDVVKGVIGKATELLTSGGGELIKLDEWGRRRLAYPIQKKNEGYYFVLTYSSLPETSKGIERSLKLNEDVLRYQTVRLDENAAAAVAAAVAAEKAAAEAAEKAAAEATQKAAAEAETAAAQTTETKKAEETEKTGEEGGDNGNKQA
ncbi:MAG: 30S ribosomal protein S6 [Thermodesulfobacteriota bacterium]